MPLKLKGIPYQVVLGARHYRHRQRIHDRSRQRIHAAFPDTIRFDATASGKALNRGIEAAHAVMVKIFQKLPAGIPLTYADIIEAENKILKAIKQTSLREWLATVGRHHTDSYRHCLLVN